MAGFSILRRLRRIGCFSLNPPALCLLAIVPGVLGIHNLSIAEESPLQKRLTNATVLRTFETEGAHIRQAQLAQDRVAFLLWKEDSSLVVVLNFDGTEHFRYGVCDSTFRRLAWINISKDAETLVITEAVNLEFFKLMVFDITGGLLFEIFSGGDLRPSPTGKFLCTASSSAISEAFTVYTRDGDKVGHLPGLAEWNFEFWDDERLLVADEDSVRLIDPRTMEAIWAVEHRLEYHLAPITPGISLSNTHSVAAVFSSRSVLLISGDGDELWRYESDDLICSAAIDDKTKALAIQFHDIRATYGYFRVYKLDKFDSGVESTKIPSLARSFRRTRDFHWFANGTIRIWGPWFVNNWKEKEEFWTLFIECGPEVRTLHEPVIIPGLYHSIIDDGGTPTRFLRVEMPGSATLLKMDRLEGR